MIAHGAHVVWARVAWAAVDLAGELGVPPASLLVDLPYDLDELHRRSKVPWADYCAICERVGDAAGGLPELEDLLAASYHRMLPELRFVAGSLVGPRLFLHFVLEVIDSLMFPPMDIEAEDLLDGRVRISQVLRPGARPCLAFMRGSVGALRGVPAHLGLPMADIEVRELGGDRLIADLRLPPARSLADRAGTVARLAARFVLGRDRQGTELSVTVGWPDGDPTHYRLERATMAWKLTPRQADVLARLVAGLSNKEIANELGCAENTVELHVTRLLRKGVATSRAQLTARFWSAAWDAS